MTTPRVGDSPRSGSGVGDCFGRRGNLQRHVLFVSQRTKKVGIRVALGATRRDVLCLVIGETCRLAMVGAVGGCMAAYAAGRPATGQVYLSPGLATRQIQTASLNPAAFILGSLFLFGVALCASYVPARRALRVDPMLALRHE